MLVFWLTLSGVTVMLYLTRNAWRFAPWVPTPAADVQRALSAAGVGPEDVLYDLGCGDGRVLVAADRLGARAIGVEISLPFVWWSRARIALSGARNATVVRGDLFARPVSDATVIFLYGLPRSLGNEVRRKLEAEVEPGTRVVCYDFPIEGWRADSVIPAREGWCTKPIHLYRVLRQP